MGNSYNPEESFKELAYPTDPDVKRRMEGEETPVATLPLFKEFTDVSDEPTLPLSRERYKRYKELLEIVPERNMSRLDYFNYLANLLSIKGLVKYEQKDVFAPRLNQMVWAAKKKQEELIGQYKEVVRHHHHTHDMIPALRAKAIEQKARSALNHFESLVKDSEKGNRPEKYAEIIPVLGNGHPLPADSDVYINEYAPRFERLHPYNRYADFDTKTVLDLATDAIPFMQKFLDEQEAFYKNHKPNFIKRGLAGLLGIFTFGLLGNKFIFHASTLFREKGLEEVREKKLHLKRISSGLAEDLAIRVGKYHGLTNVLSEEDTNAALSFVQRYGDYRVGRLPLAQRGQFLAHIEGVLNIFNNESPGFVDWLFHTNKYENWLAEQGRLKIKFKANPGFFSKLFNTQSYQNWVADKQKYQDIYDHVKSVPSIAILELVNHPKLGEFFRTNCTTLIRNVVEVDANNLVTDEEVLNYFFNFNNKARLQDVILQWKRNQLFEDAENKDSLALLAECYKAASALTETSKAPAVLDFSIIHDNDDAVIAGLIKGYNKARQEKAPNVQKTDGIIYPNNIGPFKEAINGLLSPEFEKIFKAAHKEYFKREYSTEDIRQEFSPEVLLHNTAAVVEKKIKFIENLLLITGQKNVSKENLLPSDSSFKTFYNKADANKKQTVKLLLTRLHSYVSKTSTCSMATSLTEQLEALANLDAYGPIMNLIFRHRVSGILPEEGQPGKLAEKDLHQTRPVLQRCLKTAIEQNKLKLFKSLSSKERDVTTTRIKVAETLLKIIEGNVDPADIKAADLELLKEELPTYRLEREQNDYQDPVHSTNVVYYLINKYIQYEILQVQQRKNGRCDHLKLASLFEFAKTYGGQKDAFDAKFQPKFEQSDMFFKKLLLSSREAPYFIYNDSFSVDEENLGFIFNNQANKAVANRKNKAVKESSVSIVKLEVGADLSVPLTLSEIHQQWLHVYANTDFRATFHQYLRAYLQGFLTVELEKLLQNGEMTEQEVQQLKDAYIKDKNANLGMGKAPSLVHTEAFLTANNRTSWSKSLKNLFEDLADYDADGYYPTYGLDEFDGSIDTLAFVFLHIADTTSSIAYTKKLMAALLSRSKVDLFQSRTTSEFLKEVVTNQLAYPEVYEVVRHAIYDYIHNEAYEYNPITEVSLKHLKDLLPVPSDYSDLLQQYRVKYVKYLLQESLIVRPSHAVEFQSKIEEWISGEQGLNSQPITENTLFDSAGSELLNSAFQDFLNKYEDTECNPHALYLMKRLGDTAIVERALLNKLKTTLFSVHKLEEYDEGEDYYLAVHEARTGEKAKNFIAELVAGAQVFSHISGNRSYTMKSLYLTPSNSFMYSNTNNSSQYRVQDIFRSYINQLAGTNSFNADTDWEAVLQAINRNQERFPIDQAELLARVFASNEELRVLRMLKVLTLLCQDAADKSYSQFLDSINNQTEVVGFIRDLDGNIVNASSIMLPLRPVTEEDRAVFAHLFEWYRKTKSPELKHHFNSKAENLMIAFGTTEQRDCYRNVRIKEVWNSNNLAVAEKFVNASLYGQGRGRLRPLAKPCHLREKENHYDYNQPKIEDRKNVGYAELRGIVTTERAKQELQEILSEPVDYIESYSPAKVLLIAEYGTRRQLRDCYLARLEAILTGRGLPFNFASQSNDTRWDAVDFENSAPFFTKIYTKAPTKWERFSRDESALFGSDEGAAWTVKKIEEMFTGYKQTYEKHAEQAQTDAERQQLLSTYTESMQKLKHIIQLGIEKLKEVQLEVSNAEIDKVLLYKPINEADIAAKKTWVKNTQRLIDKIFNATVSNEGATAQERATETESALLQEWTTLSARLSNLDNMSIHGHKDTRDSLLKLAGGLSKVAKEYSTLRSHQRSAKGSMSSDNYLLQQRAEELEQKEETILDIIRGYICFASDPAYRIVPFLAIMALNYENGVEDELAQIGRFNYHPVVAQLYMDLKQTSRAGQYPQFLQAIWQYLLALPQSDYSKGIVPVINNYRAQPYSKANLESLATQLKRLQPEAKLVEEYLYGPFADAFSRKLPSAKKQMVQSIIGGMPVTATKLELIYGAFASIEKGQANSFIYNDAPVLYDDIQVILDSLDTESKVGFANEVDRLLLKQDPGSLLHTQLTIFRKLVTAPAGFYETLKEVSAYFFDKYQAQISAADINILATLEQKGSKDKDETNEQEKAKQKEIEGDRILYAALKKLQQNLQHPVLSPAKFILCFVDMVDILHKPKAKAARKKFINMLGDEMLDAVDVEQIAEEKAQAENQPKIREANLEWVSKCNIFKTAIEVNLEDGRDTYKQALSKKWRETANIGESCYSAIKDLVSYVDSLCNNVKPAKSIVNILETISEVAADAQRQQVNSPFAKYQPMVQAAMQKLGGTYEEPNAEYQDIREQIDAFWNTGILTKEQTDTFQRAEAHLNSCIALLDKVGLTNVLISKEDIDAVKAAYDAGNKHHSYAARQAKLSNVAVSLVRDEFVALPPIMLLKLRNFIVWAEEHVKAYAGKTYNDLLLVSIQQSLNNVVLVNKQGALLTAQKIASKPVFTMEEMAYLMVAYQAEPALRTCVMERVKKRLQQLIVPITERASCIIELFAPIFENLGDASDQAYFVEAKEYIRMQTVRNAQDGLVALYRAERMPSKEERAPFHTLIKQFATPAETAETTRRVQVAVETKKLFSILKSGKSLEYLQHVLEYLCTQTSPEERAAIRDTLNATGDNPLLLTRMQRASYSLRVDIIDKLEGIATKSPTYLAECLALLEANLQPASNDYVYLYEGTLYKVDPAQFKQQEEEHIQNLLTSYMVLQVWGNKEQADRARNLVAAYIQAFITSKQESAGFFKAAKGFLSGSNKKDNQKIKLVANLIYRWGSKEDYNTANNTSGKFGTEIQRIASSLGQQQVQTSSRIQRIVSRVTSSSSVPSVATSPNTVGSNTRQQEDDADYDETTSNRSSSASSTTHSPVQQWADHGIETLSFTDLNPSEPESRQENVDLGRQPAADESSSHDAYDQRYYINGVNSNLAGQDGYNEGYYEEGVNSSPTSQYAYNSGNGMGYDTTGQYGYDEGTSFNPTGQYEYNSGSGMGYDTTGQYGYGEGTGSNSTGQYEYNSGNGMGYDTTGQYGYDEGTSSNQTGQYEYNSGNSMAYDTTGHYSQGYNATRGWPSASNSSGGSVANAQQYRVFTTSTPALGGVSLGSSYLGQSADQSEASEFGIPTVPTAYHPYR